MGKPGSKSLSRKGEQSEGPEHKAKTAAPKNPFLVFADLLYRQGRPQGFGKIWIDALKPNPVYGSKHLRKDWPVKAGKVSCHERLLQ